MDSPDKCTECGNGIRDLNEECDDLNTVSGDGCSSSCRIEQYYDCINTMGSKDICQAKCGDGVIFGEEVCDDGNVESGDGCPSDCLAYEVNFYCF